ncbi:hypothetical protein FRX31_011035 [Thalictrum thalictroides]|uniref:Uncharacterized protein n=1 Tax=Thalictrum thalictroides TaxID=46969 RepID=A0A7J6WR36_THATH|nr:hypothetical protein FRX31_011035 [Thalictrum thalictroides]
MLAQDGVINPTILNLYPQSTRNAKLSTLIFHSPYVAVSEDENNEEEEFTINTNIGNDDVVITELVTRDEEGGFKARSIGIGYAVTEMSSIHQYNCPLLL